MNFLVFFIFSVCISLNAFAQEAWQQIKVDGVSSQVKAVAIDKNNHKALYAGSPEGLFKTIDGGKSWKALAIGLIDKVNFLYGDIQDTEIIYAATENGLFRSQDSGDNWQKIFVGKDIQEKNVLALTLCYEPPKTIFIATENGIFFSPVNRIQWQKVGGALLEARVSSLIVNPSDSDELFIASSKGLFKTQNRLASYEKLLNSFNPEVEDSAADIDSSEEEIAPQEYTFRYIAIDPRNQNRLYLATFRGLISSLDGGQSWKKEVLSGLLDEKINYIAVDGALTAKNREKILLATDTGVFECGEGACRQMYQGVDSKRCNQIAQDSEGNLYLASDGGLFRISLRDNPQQEAKKDELKDAPIHNSEATILEIQQEAIKYAEVYPEKIANWRKQARMRAFFPEIDLTYDKTVFTSVNFPQGRGFVGPLDWGVSLSWDVGDFIFSTEQTSIDVRSRLMVQLRDDIINEVTRLYFERKRLQAELIGAEDLNPKSKAEKELRLEEITALIDGLTGGYLSRH